MAVTAATLSSDFSGFLNRQQAQPIFELAAKMSVVQRLAQEAPLGANGTAIPVVTGRLTAGWVSEGGQKPASAGTMALKTMDPKKIAVIAVVSAEVVRANPGNYMNVIRGQVAASFANAFDRAALHDEGPTGGAGGGPFATYIDQSANSVEIGTGTTIHNDFVAALSALVADGQRLTGWAFDDLMEPLILNAADSTNRPLYVDTPLDTTTAAANENVDAWVRRGRLIGRTSWMGPDVATANGTSVIGYGGDWSQAAWGVVGGISFDVSTEATVTIDGSYVSLWEHNLVAVRAEAEYGFVVNNTDAFVKLTNAS